MTHSSRPAPRQRHLLLAATIAVMANCGQPSGNDTEGRHPGECSDGADNDSDGFFDCVDSDCFGAPACESDADAATSVDAIPIDTPSLVDASASADASPDATQGDLAAPGVDSDQDGWFEGWGDCNDGVATINPGATENESNLTDDDCDGVVDEAGGAGGGCNQRLTAGTPGVTYDYATAFGYPIGDGSSESHCIEPPSPDWWVCTEFLDGTSCVAGCDGGATTHLGEDWNYGSGTDDVGRPVYAIADGVVTYIDPPSASWVRTVAVRHDAHPGQSFSWAAGGTPASATTIWSHYAHIDVDAAWAVGSRVAKGDRLGVVSATLCTMCSGPHLHFEILVDCRGQMPGYGYRASGDYRVDPSGFLNTVALVGTPTQAPTIAITSPSALGSYTANSSPLTVAGTQTEAATVAWSSTAGGSGPCAFALGSFSCSSILLTPGPQTITVTATNVIGSTDDTLVVTYEAPPPPPAITITSPTSSSTHTTVSTPISVAGSQTNAAAVGWLSTTGSSGSCSRGAGTFTCSNIALGSGPQTITVTASNASGSANDTLVVTYTPPPSETCNGIDDDGNGVIDDPGSCWLAIYRFQNANGARCWGTTGTPPSTCPGYTYELEAWVVPAQSVPGTFLARQCSKSTDHIIVPSGSADQSALQSAGYDCSVMLGYPYYDGAGPADGATPWTRTCDIWRYSHMAGSSGAHFFTRGADTVTGMTCEPPVRAEVLSNFSCFSGTAPGC